MVNHHQTTIWDFYSKHLVLQSKTRWWFESFWDDPIWRFFFSNGLGNNHQLEYIFWESENPPGFPLLRIFWPPKNQKEVPTKNSHIEAAGKTGGLVKIIYQPAGVPKVISMVKPKGGKKKSLVFNPEKSLRENHHPMFGFFLLFRNPVQKNHLGCTYIFNNEINYQLQLVNAGFQSSTIGLNPCKGPITVLPRCPHLGHFQHDFILGVARPFWKQKSSNLEGTLKVLANRRQSD